MGKLQITNPKSQTNYKFQKRKSLVWNLWSVVGVWFGIWCLGSGICAEVRAETVSSSELINKAKDYDNQTVFFQGEVIGDVMARGVYAWVNLNDGKNALGIWVRKDLAAAIANTGSYKVIGDLIEVSGVFHRSCLIHGGDLDIHAESLRVVKSGNRVRQRLSLRRQKIAFGLGAILIILWISTILIKPRKRK